MTNVAKNQYLLTAQPMALEQMVLYRLGGLYLYADAGLPVCALENGAGERVLLLGDAFCTDAPGKTAREDIARWNGDELLELTRFWTGRWAVLTADAFCTDACSMLSAFLCCREERWYVSSSLALLAELGLTQRTRTDRLRDTAWQILPETGFDGVRKLLCTQKLTFQEGVCAIAPHLWMQDLRQMDTEQKTAHLSRLLVNGLTNVHRYSGRRLLLALTGGKDSRLVLAALLKAQVPFEAYTAEHDNISTCDVKTPRKFSRAFTFSHTYVRRSGKPDEALAADFHRFTAGNAPGEDARFYAYGQFARLPGDAMVIRGGFFEAGQTYARSIARGDAHFRQDMEGYDPVLKTDALQRRGMDVWFQNVEAHPVAHVDLRDRYYIEQRVGGWGAAIEQALSINDFRSIQIANCPELLSVLLSCNGEERANLALSMGPIRLLCEPLLAESFNQVSLADRCRRLRRILRDPVGKIRKVLHKYLRKQTN